MNASSNPTPHNACSRRQFLAASAAAGAAFGACPWPVASMPPAAM